MRALLFAFECGTRLAVVVALLFVAADSRLAATIAVAASIAAAARALVRGEVVKREIERGWRELVRGIRRKDVTELSAYRESDEGVAAMVDAVREVALVRATSTPEIAAQLVALAVLAALIVVRLSWTWLVSGLFVALVLGLVVRVAQRRQSLAQARAYAALGGIARDARALVEAAPELRVMAREERFAQGLLRATSAMAVDERAVLRLGAAAGLGPSFVALASLALPPGALSALADRAHLVDLGVLGGAAISTAMGLVHSFEALSRSAPYRAAFARVAGASDEASPPPAALGTDVIRAFAVEGLSVRRAGADRSTPFDLSFALAHGGIAIGGSNGAGKSSAILAMLGLVERSRGVVRVNGSELTSSGVESLRGRVSYLSQRPYVAPGESLRWHAELLVDDEERLLAALADVGLVSILSSRAGGARGVLELSMGTLSGGERQRFFIARALARPADLIILDEPEAGLDTHARTQLRELFELAARDRLVVLVAHDPAIVPKSFAEIQCRPEREA